MRFRLQKQLNCNVLVNKRQYTHFFVKFSRNFKCRFVQYRRLNVYFIFKQKQNTHRQSQITIQCMDITQAVKRWRRFLNVEKDHCSINDYSFCLCIVHFGDQNGQMNDNYKKKSSCCKVKSVYFTNNGAQVRGRENLKTTLYLP